MNIHGCLIILTFVAAGLVAGCQAPRPVTSEAAREQLLSLLMPSRIEIVEPFTRVKSFDDDTTPDGIELLLEAVNYLDNPGLMIVGDIRVELYEYVPASGDHKAERINYWEIPLRTPAQQRTYWSQLTQMYEFRLSVDTAKMTPSDRYVLLVTYNSPLDEHLTDECVLHYRTAGNRSASRRATRP